MSNIGDLPLILIKIAFSFALILLNGFFVAAEFAVVKVRRTRLQELEGQGIKAAKASIASVDQMDEYLSATQLGITFASLALGWIAEQAFVDLFSFVAPQWFGPFDRTSHLIAVGFAFFLITMLHVVLGELVPKSIAIQRSEQVMLKVSWPMMAFFKMSQPLIKLFSYLANMIIELLGLNREEGQPLSEQELKMVMKESREDGVISESEAQIINRAFEFSDKRASDIMVHAEAVDYISLSRTLDENLSTIRKHMYTRFPLCQKGFDTVIGIVHIKDVWPHLTGQPASKVFLKSCHPAIFIPPEMREDQIMRIFQSRRQHMAIVRSRRRSSNLGIVTMEDVLEELVGDISDEHGN